MKRIKTKYQGVYQRKSDSRNHNGKRDICFDIAYQVEGKLTWEKVGWISEGYTPRLASHVRSERVRATRHREELPKQRMKAPFFRDVAAKYLAWARDNKARGGRDDICRYRKHLSPCFDNKRLNEISSFDLERLKANLTKQGLAPATVKQCLVLFRQMVNKAIDWDLFSGKNPAKRFKMPVVANQRDRFLSYDEADLLLKELAKISIQLHDEALLSLHCGLRASEVFNLTWNDVDLEHGLLTVRDGKTGTRPGYMTKTIKAMLTNRKPFADNDFVFPEHTGGKQKQVSNSFRRVVKKLEFNNSITDRRQRLVFHSLRHTYASWHVQNGTDLYTVQKLMGHSSFSMVQRYAHLSEGTLQKAVKNLEESISAKNNVTERPQRENAGQVVNFKK